mgnify:CR=1 FL=1
MPDLVLVRCVYIVLLNDVYLQLGYRCILLLQQGHCCIVFLVLVLAGYGARVLHLQHLRLQFVSRGLDLLDGCFRVCLPFFIRCLRL